MPVLRLLSIALLGMPCALMAAPAQRVADLAPAQAALAARDYGRAHALYQKAAPASAFAQFMLGMFHQQGWGRPSDPLAACRWFAKAAVRLVPAAQHRWGDCLAEGIGQAPDIPGAIAQYRGAAEGGHLISWCFAADFYIQGRGVPKDVAQGLALCAQAAHAHSPPAMLKLAGYYASGQDLPPDLAQSRYWYGQAAQYGAVEAQYKLALMLAQGEGGPPEPDAAVFWLESAASAGYAQAYLPVAKMYASAPVQADSGALAPEHLAKIYLWTAAARARPVNPEQRAEAEQLEAQVLSVMPATWRPNLDRQVAEHLAKLTPTVPHSR